MGRGTISMPAPGLSTQTNVFQVSGVIGKLATKVHKYNKRGIDLHFLNQQSRASMGLKVSKVLVGRPILARADAKPVIATDKVKI